MRPKGFKQPLFCVNNKISNNFNTYLTDPFKNISFNINSSADNATTTNFNNNNFTNNYLFNELIFKSFVILNQVKIKILTKQQFFILYVIVTILAILILFKIRKIIKYKGKRDGI